MTSLHRSKRYSFRAAPRERVETFDASVDGADSFLKGPLTMVSRRAHLVGYNSTVAGGGLRHCSIYSVLVACQNTAERLWRVLGATFFQNLMPKRVGPALRPWTVSRSGLSSKIQHAMISVQGRERQDLVDAFTPLVLSARLGDTSSCAWMVAFSARAAIFIIAALYAAEIAFPRCRTYLKKWQLSSPPPFHQPSPRLLLWRIQETPVGTRSNAARFSGVSRTIHSITG